MKSGVEDFVVESTPVLDLKKHSLPSSGVAKDANWDSDRTEVYADADGESAIASLVGEQGDVYPITTFPFVIGRGSECDLVLQGKGISRRHAEIIFQAGRFIVNDLESLNGVKVNGYKVSRVILEENDSLRLGEVALIFRSKGGAADDSRRAKSGSAQSGFFSKKSRESHATPVDDNTFGSSPSKKLATQFAVVVALALVSVAGYQFWLSQNQPQGKVVEVSSSSRAAAAPQSMPQVQAQPQAAATTASAPTVAEPPVQAAAADLAPAASSAEEVATSSSVAGSPDSIEPPPSLAPPPSIAKTAPGAPPKVAPRPAAVAPASVSTPDPVVQRTQQRPAEPAAASRGGEAGQARQDLVRAQDLYFKGDAQNAIALLKPLVESQSLSASLKAEVRTAYSNYSTLYNQYGAAQSAYANGDKEGAFQGWDAFMSKEGSLFGGRKSAYTQNISSRVVGEYVTLGNEASRAGDHHKAYRFWQKALDVGDNVAARIAIDNANNKAMQLYRQALRLEYVNTSKARAQWQQVTELLPPGTEYHTKASAKLAWYDKWGS